MNTFEQDLVKAVQDAILKQVRDNGFVSLPYEQRIKVDGALLREAYANINREMVSAQITAIIEERLSDLIWNALATELSNDVKQILSNRELREEVRAVLRDQIRKVAGTLKEESQ